MNESDEGGFQVYNDNDDHLPLAMVTPFECNEKLQGLDLFSFLACAAAIDEARHTGLAQASKMIVLPSMSGERQCILVFNAVYKNEVIIPKGFVIAALLNDKILDCVAAIDNSDIIYISLFSSSPERT